MVYVQSDSVYPVLNEGADGQTGFTEPGSSLPPLRIVLRELGINSAPPAPLVAVRTPGLP